MAEVVHINNGYQGGRDPNSVNMDATVAGVITIREELARLQNRVEVQDLYIKELEASNAKHVEDKEQMTAEIAELKRVLADPKAEIESLKSDVQSFKQWTKKLDWSTANIPDALTKHYEIKQVKGLKDRHPFYDIPVTYSSVQTVDGVYHGAYEYTRDKYGHVSRGYYVNGKVHGVMNATVKGYWSGEGEGIAWMGKNLYRALKRNLDGGMVYQCADEEKKGVAVTVLTEERQKDERFDVKNGYSISLHTYKDEILVEKIGEDTVVSEKWYQLKK